MKTKLIPLAAVLMASLLASCDSKAPGSSGTEPPATPTPPAPPSAEVRAALEAQAVGKKLLGNTQLLVGDGFVAADLQTAPELYLVHFSASW